VKIVINLQTYQKNIYSRAGVRDCPCYGEDGVLLKIAEVLGWSRGLKVIEFGESRIFGTTTRSLRLAHKARALYFSTSLGIRSKILNILDIFKLFVATKKFDTFNYLLNRPIKAHATDTISSFIKSRGYFDAEVLCIDIDSYDYYIVSKLLDEKFRPKLFIVEYNPNLPNEIPLTVPNETIYQPDIHGRIYGCNFKAWENLFSREGYSLVYICGFTNLYYLRNDSAEFFCRPGSLLPMSDDDIVDFCEKWCLPAFRPSWIRYPRPSPRDLKWLVRL
jgi:hypothetical protein